MDIVRRWPGHEARTLRLALRMSVRVVKPPGLPPRNAELLLVPQVDRWRHGRGSGVDVLPDARHLDTQAGYALVRAGILALADDRSAAKTLVRRGEKLLRTGAYAVAMNHSGQRRAMFEGAWLANAAAARGHLEKACEFGRTALARAATVRLSRSFDVLRRLASRLRRFTRNEYVRDFLPELEAGLSRHQGTAI